MPDETPSEWDSEFRGPKAAPPAWTPPSQGLERKAVPLEAVPELGGTLLPGSDPLIRRQKLKRTALLVSWGLLGLGCVLLVVSRFIEWKPKTAPARVAPEPSRDAEQAVSSFDDGLAMIFRKDYRGAREAFAAMEAAGAVPPDRQIDFYQKYGDLALLNGNYSLAVEQYQNAIAAHRWEVPSKLLNNLAYILSEQGTDLEKAEIMVQAALKQEPKNPAYLDTLGLIQMGRKKFDRAEEAFRKGLSSDPAEPRLRAYLQEHLGDCLSRQNRTEEALTFWRQAAALIPEDNALWQKIGKAKN